LIILIQLELTLLIQTVIQLQKDINIYPNPGPSVLYLNSSTDLVNKIIPYSKYVWKRCLDHELDSYSINIQSLPNGLYIIESRSKNDRIKITKYVKI